VGSKEGIYVGRMQSLFVCEARVSEIFLSDSNMARWVCTYMIHLKVGGRVQGYKGLTFVTIRGAGHEVPLLQHSRFLQMLRVYLADKSLPATPYV
jgi:hypothetical protein